MQTTEEILFCLFITTKVTSWQNFFRASENKYLAFLLVLYILLFILSRLTKYQLCTGSVESADPTSFYFSLCASARNGYHQLHVPTPIQLPERPWTQKIFWVFSFFFLPKPIFPVSVISSN